MVVGSLSSYFFYLSTALVAIIELSSSFIPSRYLTDYKVELYTFLLFIPKLNILNDVGKSMAISSSNALGFLSKYFFKLVS